MIYNNFFNRELDILGSGYFGTVYRAVWICRPKTTNSILEDEVAVKKIEGGASEHERVHFLQEAAVMGQFNHPNIVKILGVVANPELVCNLIYLLLQ